MGFRVQKEGEEGEGLKRRAEEVLGNGITLVKSAFRSEEQQRL